MTDAHAFVVFDFENGAPPAARLHVEDAVKRTLCAAAWAVVIDGLGERRGGAGVWSDCHT